MKHISPTIVLTGGGSGGHITPLLSLARELKTVSPGCQIIYIGYKGDDFDSFRATGHDFDFMAFINAGKFRRYHGGVAGGLFNLETLALNARDFFRLPGSVYKAWRLLRKFKPDLVFSKGGFVAVPVGIAARFLRIPTVTHDSDPVPGLANRIVGRWAVIHATGMAPRFYPYPQSTIRHTGVPIDERIVKVTPKVRRQAREELGLPAENPVLLVSGGGNGSRPLNDLLLKIAGELLETNLSLRIIHLTGKNHEAEVKQVYHGLPRPDQKRLIVQGFSDDFQKFVAAADVIVTRAGATTLAELAAAGKACIVIPAPFLAGGHQLRNADELAAHDAAVIAPDRIQPDELLALINSLLADDRRRFELSRNIYGLAKPDATAELARIILQVAAKHAGEGRR